MNTDALPVWHLITGLGNLLFTGLLMLVIAAWLIASGARMAALKWCVLCATAMALVLATKIAFIGWGIGIETLDFTGISGHAARAGLVFPLLFYLLMGNSGRRWVGVIPGVALAGLVACSRVMVHAHSSSEALSGFVLGCGFSILFCAQFDCVVLLPSRWWAGACLAALLVIGPSHKMVTTDRLVTRLALTIAGHDVAVTRNSWHRTARRHTD